MPRIRTLTLASTAAVAFVGGVACTAVVSRFVSPAFAQSTPLAPLTAQIIDIDALDGAAIGPIVPNTQLRSKLLVATEQATIAVQQGDVGRHYHAGSDEIQYILAGTGTFWLGDSQRQLKAGDLVIIPKGTSHAGTIATSGTFKALAIKIPPQAAGDTHFVP